MFKGKTILSFCCSWCRVLFWKLLGASRTWTELRVLKVRFARCSRPSEFRTTCDIGHFEPVVLRISCTNDVLLFAMLFRPLGTSACPLNGLSVRSHVSTSIRNQFILFLFLRLFDSVCAEDVASHCFSRLTSRHLVRLWHNLRTSLLSSRLRRTAAGSMRQSQKVHFELRLIETGF